MVSESIQDETGTIFAFKYGESVLKQQIFTSKREIFSLLSIACLLTQIDINKGRHFYKALRNNKGECGLCGDKFDSLRENEYKGKYATGIIGKNYTEGATVPFTVQFVIGRPGFFEFKLCKILPGDKNQKKASQKCLDTNVLKASNGSTKLQIGSPINKNITFEMALPKGLTCDRCVIQWTYTTSVVYGCNARREDCCFGCGVQEKYVNCADISIKPREFTDHSTTEYPVVNVANSAVPVSSNIQDLLNTQKSQLATLAKLKVEMAKLQDFHQDGVRNTASEANPVSTNSDITTPTPTISVAITPSPISDQMTASPPLPPLPPVADPQNFQDFVKAFFSVTKKLQGGPQSPSEIMDVLRNIKIPKPTTQSPMADAEKFLTNLLYQNKNVYEGHLPQPNLSGYLPNKGIVPQPTVPQQPLYPPVPQRRISGYKPNVPNVIQQPNFSGIPPQISTVSQAPFMHMPGMNMPQGVPYQQSQFPSQLPTINPFTGTDRPYQFSQLSEGGIPTMEQSSSAAADLLGIDIPSGMNAAGLETMFSMMGRSATIPEIGSQNTMGEMGQMNGFMDQFVKMITQNEASIPLSPSLSLPHQQPLSEPSQVPAPQPNPPTNLVSIASLPPLTIDTISDSQRTDILEKLKLANVVMSKQVPPVGINEKLEAYRVVIDTALKKFTDERDQKLISQNPRISLTTPPSNTTTQNPQLLAQQKQISELRQELQRLKNLTVNKSTKLTPESNPYTVPVIPHQQLPHNGPPMSEVQLLDSLFGSGSQGFSTGLGTPSSVPPFMPGQGSSHPLHSRPIDFNSYDPFTLMGGGMGGLGVPGLGFGLGEPLLKCDFVGTGEIEWPCMRYCQAEAMTCVPKRQFPQYRKRCATDCAIL